MHLLSHRFSPSLLAFAFHMLSKYTTGTNGIADASTRVVDASICYPIGFNVAINLCSLTKPFTFRKYEGCSESSDPGMIYLCNQQRNMPEHYHK